MRTHATRDSTRDRAISTCPLCDAKCHEVPPSFSGLLPGTAQFQHVRFSTPNAKGTTHPCPGLSDLRHAQQGIAQLRHVRFATPNAKGTTHPCPELSHLRPTQPGIAQPRHFLFTTPNAKGT